MKNVEQNNDFFVGNLFVVKDGSKPFYGVLYKITEGKYKYHIHWFPDDLDTTYPEEDLYDTFRKIQ